MENIEELYESIINDLSNLKVIEEAKVKEFNYNVKIINDELKYFGNHSKCMKELDWFNDTVILNKIRNNVIELKRLMQKDCN
jgi:hypothetical protein